MNKMYLRTSTKAPTRTPQTVKTQPSQVLNDAGGAVWKISPWQQLYRFLIMGSPSDYYADEKTRTKQNLDAIFAVIRENALGVVNRVTEISTAKPVRAVSNDPSVFVLSVVLKIGTIEAKREALRVYNSVVRTGTDFLHSVDVMKKQRGSSRYANLAMRGWLAQPNAYFQIAKYFNRDGVTMRDALRLAHPHPTNAEQDVIFAWVAAGGDVQKIGVSKKATPTATPWNEPNWAHERQSQQKRYAIETANEDSPKSMQFLRAVESLKKNLKGSALWQSPAEIIKKYHLPWEVVPTELRKDRDIALQSLEQMPANALIKQLGRYGAMGLLAEPDVMAMVVGKLTDKEYLVEARVHPLKILQALMIYRHGKGDKGSLTWRVESEIVDALDQAFELSFASYVPHGKKVLIAVDISGSMTDRDAIGMSHIRASQAAVAFAAIMARREPNAKVVLFDKAVQGDLLVSKRSSFFNLVEDTYRNGGGTDCSAPIKWATERKAIYDGIVIITDNQSYAGDRHVYQAMQDYRRKVAQKARFFVAAVAGNTCTIADPNDPLSMNGVGFDTNAPEIVREFILGNM